MARHLSVDTTTLIVWDSEQPCPLTDGFIVLWQQFTTDGDSSSIISISDYIEEHATEIRSKILEFIHDVGEQTVGNRSLKEHLRVEDGFSYFWMTHFHSRLYTQSGQLNNIAKTIALSGIIKACQIKRVVVYSRNRSLITVLESVAKNHDVTFRFMSITTKSKRVKRSSWKTRVKSVSPALCLAALALGRKRRAVHYLGRQDSIFETKGDISFFDYWYRFGSSVHSMRKFQSQYWTQLVDTLSDARIATNWIHNLVDERGSVALREARSLRDDFNDSNLYQQHVILDAVATPFVFWRSVRGYLRLFLGSFPLLKYRHLFVIGDTCIDFWPLLRREWRTSLRGYEAMTNCLRFHSLDAVLSKLPRQRMGIYLMENQPWELAMIHLWHKHGHGHLVGVAHSTVRFWDLRFLSDPRSFPTASYFPMPRPDSVAVNGSLARRSLLEAKYPEHELVDVEALMYLHLKHSQRRPRYAGTPTLLVATDFLESATRVQMQILDDFLAIHNDDIRILLKPHWSQTFTGLNPRIEVVSGREDLAIFFDRCDVMYCSAITSAVIDGVCAGLPVIQCLDPTSFNLSPLRGYPEIQVVRTGKELAVAFVRAQEIVSTTEPNTLFNLDPSLKKWRALLDIREVGASQT